MLWRCKIALGKYLMSKRQVDEAEAIFEEARKVISELAAELVDETLRTNFRRRASALIPALGVPTPRQAAKRAHDGLTAAEQQVATLVARGKSNREIAATQVVSIKTVEAHIANIFSKLAVRDRAEAIVRAREAGLGGEGVRSG